MHSIPDVEIFVKWKNLKHQTCSKFTVLTHANWRAWPWTEVMRWKEGAPFWTLLHITWAWNPAKSELDSQGFGDKAKSNSQWTVSWLAAPLPVWLPHCHWQAAKPGDMWAYWFSAGTPSPLTLVLPGFLFKTQWHACIFLVRGWGMAGKDRGWDVLWYGLYCVSKIFSKIWKLRYIIFLERCWRNGVASCPHWCPSIRHHCSISVAWTIVGKLTPQVCLAMVLCSVCGVAELMVARMNHWVYIG